MQIDDYVKDNGLTVLDTEADELWLCNAEPDTFTEATVTFALGTKATPAITLVNGAVDGRAAQVAAFIDGLIGANGTASHWALVDSANSRFHCAGALTGTQAVTSGNPFSMAQFNAATIRDAA
jgi:hypothetical protein